MNGRSRTTFPARRESGVCPGPSSRVSAWRRLHNQDLAGPAEPDRFERRVVSVAAIDKLSAEATQVHAVIGQHGKRRSRGKDRVEEAVDELGILSEDLLPERPLFEDVVPSGARPALRAGCHAVEAKVAWSPAARLSPATLTGRRLLPVTTRLAPSTSRPFSMALIGLSPEEPEGVGVVVEGRAHEEAPQHDPGSARDDQHPQGRGPSPQEQAWVLRVAEGVLEPDALPPFLRPSSPSSPAPPPTGARPTQSRAS